MSPLVGGDSVQLYDNKMRSEKIIYDCNAKLWDKQDSEVESKYIVEDHKTQWPCSFHGDCKTTECTQSTSHKQDDKTSSQIQDESGGARPKSTTIHSNKKSVRWAEELSETMEVQKVTIMEEEIKQFSDLINCLRQQRTFFASPAFKAVSWMYDRDEDMSAKAELAYILLYVKLHREPTVPEMMATIECEPEMDQRDLIAAIVDACESQGGASVLESFLDENDSLEQHKCLHKGHEHLELVNSEEKKPDEIPQLTKEEQSQRLKAEALRVEQSFLKNSLTCRQCKQRPVNTTFLPCGHLLLCSECSDSCYTCPLCKQQVLGEVKTYLC